MALFSHQAKGTVSTIANSVQVGLITFELEPDNNNLLVSHYKEQPSRQRYQHWTTAHMPLPYHSYPNCQGGYIHLVPVITQCQLPNFKESADICPELVMSKGVFSTMLNHQIQLINMLTKGTEHTLQGTFTPPHPAQNRQGSYQKAIPNHSHPVTPSTAMCSLHDRLSSPPTASLEATNHHVPTATCRMACRHGHHHNKNRRDCCANGQEQHTKAMDDLEKDLDVICKEFSQEHLPPEAESVDEPMDMEEECWDAHDNVAPPVPHVWHMHIQKVLPDRTLEGECNTPALSITRCTTNLCNPNA